MTQIAYFEEIIWPFESNIHSDAKLIEEKVNDWFTMYCESNELVEKFKKERLPLFSTRVYNYGTFEKVLAIAKITQYIFRLDEYFTLEDTNLAEKLATKIPWYFLKNINTAKYKWLRYGFSDVWECVSKLSPEEWNKRQLNSIATSFKARRLEIEFINDVNPSSLEYLTFRPVADAIDMCFNFIEYASDQYLSFETIAHPFFQAMIQHCRCIIMATNDLFSYNNEVVYHGNKMSLVLVYQTELNLLLEQALKKVYAYIEENLKYYLMYKKRVQQTLKQDIQFYILGLEQLMVGTYEFYFD
ncbi:Terpene synthase metal-binding domain protein-like protein [Leptotrombidium deliense]|uniref:Terpene synthase n=1 Tax=Leptotrombidium deliense TaxID=299467 RepID=A0A443SQ23_9ACAR|nr:Terpene synthase metal-binding domain protein-like protein [Leptotrombidium deliense]